MCGIFAIYGEAKFEELFWGLYSLQHRGQEGVGLCYKNGKELKFLKSSGFVLDFFSKNNFLKNLKSKCFLGHVRYSTFGGVKWENLQPIGFRYKGRWLAIAHNGNIPFASFLRKNLEKEGRTFHSTSDSEVLLHLYAEDIGDIPDKIHKLSQIAQGAFSFVIVDGENMIAFRDVYGFRPLYIGFKDENIYFSSEDCAFNMIGVSQRKELEPGEGVWIDENGEANYFKIEDKVKKFQCVFELIYFARPDSHIFGKSVYKFRVKSGELLAEDEKEDADIVVPIPDSGNYAAFGFSRKLKIPLEFGLLRNHYVGRSFIQPKMSLRKFTVKMKLLPIPETIKGKKIFLIDDSIVRGTTSKLIVDMLKEFGAKEIHFRVASPPITSPCFFGIDMPTKEELIASNKNVEDVKKFLGVDTLRYLSLDKLKKLAGEDFCYACFDGKYPDFLKREINNEI